MTEETNPKVVVIKDMSAGNDTVGEMWQETKIFNGNDTLNDVIRWAGTHKKRVTITLPDGEPFPKVPSETENRSF